MTQLYLVEWQEIIFRINHQKCFPTTYHGRCRYSGKMDHDDM